MEDFEDEDTGHPSEIDRMVKGQDTFEMRSGYRVVCLPLVVLSSILLLIML